MESTGLRHSASVSSRMSSFDVGQLDKINAIPNKTTNDVLLDGLTTEDKLYLDTLMDEDSSESESEHAANGSPWSPPMAGRPMRMGGNHRVKRRMMRKPSYAITLSLEDISYIRPSWGLSKGVKKMERTSKKVEANKSKVLKTYGPKRKTSDIAAPSAASVNAGTNEKLLIDELDKDSDAGKRIGVGVNPYYLFLIVVMLILITLMILSHAVDLGRNETRIQENRIKIDPQRRTFTIFKRRDSTASSQLRVNYGRGIPGNLKHETCTCEMYDQETRRLSGGGGGGGGGGGQSTGMRAEGSRNCFGCFDWAMRANMQIFVNNTSARRHALHSMAAAGLVHLDAQPEELEITCYDIKWQSYDTLATPLIDCVQLGGGGGGAGSDSQDQWFGLGDIQTPLWPVNKFDQLDFVALQSNLSAEFSSASSIASQSKRQLTPEQRLNFGSHAHLTLLSSSGFLVGNLRSDFQPLIKISQSEREICLSVSCLDKCTQVWSQQEDRPEVEQKLKFENNLLEYSICSAADWRLLSSQLADERLYSLPPRSRTTQNSTIIANNNYVAQSQATPPPSESRSIESEASGVNNSSSQFSKTALPARKLEGIGLIERTIFKTSREFMVNLDGQTVRQLVDKIIKLNLKTSPILLLDTRWQTHVGSFKLNSALFPKAKLLFEILHNKGFKIVLQVKPYIDASIGLAAVNQLMELRRLVRAHYLNDYEINSPSVRARQLVLMPAQIRSHLDYFKAESSLANTTGSTSYTTTIVRRRSFFRAENETIYYKDGQLQNDNENTRKPPPHLFECRESYNEQCLLIDLSSSSNRAWMIELIKRSSFLSQEADAIQLAGAHPDALEWEHKYRRAMYRLIEELSGREQLYVVPQWSGNFNYIQLGPRERTWDSLRSIVESVLNLGTQGFALIHPGSVWGDVVVVGGEGFESTLGGGGNAAGESTLIEWQRQRDEELIVRWLQLAIFLPILQFNDLAPIERFQLHDQLANLIRIRKLHVVPEVKRNLPYTPLIHLNGLEEFWATRRAGVTNNQQLLPQHAHLAALRYTWTSGGGGGGGAGSNSQQQSSTSKPLASEGRAGQTASKPEVAIGQQFMIGPDLLVAPVLLEGQRQKDIYLPAGIWHDELRQTNVRGGKWLRNYPIELNEIAWFTRARR